MPSNDDPRIEAGRALESKRRERADVLADLLRERETERARTAEHMEEKRVERAEVLAANQARVDAELRSHQSHLDHINGSIADLALAMKDVRNEFTPVKMEMVELKGAVKELSRDVNTINTTLVDKAADEVANRRSVKIALYGLTGTIVASGIGAVIALLAGG